MRAAQVIVVGDNKQLPPTSFFRSEVGDEDEAEDLESILDECSALNIKQQMLLWHYRSRHESLIAFSNRRIYDGRLYTFPSPGREGGEWGVSYVRVQDGVYDRSGDPDQRGGGSQGGGVGVRPFCPLPGALPGRGRVQRGPAAGSDRSAGKHAQR